MTAEDGDAVVSADAAVGAEAEESPETLPPRAWVSLLLFAVFVVGFSSCAGLFMFR